MPQQDREQMFLHEMKQAIKDKNVLDVRRVKKKYYPYYYNFPEGSTVLAFALVTYDYRNCSVDECMGVINELVKQSSLEDLNKVMFENETIVRLALKWLQNHNDVILSFIKNIKKSGYNTNRFYNNNKSDLTYYIRLIAIRFVRVFDLRIFYELSVNVDTNVLKRCSQELIRLSVHLDCMPNVVLLLKDNGVSIDGNTFNPIQCLLHQRDIAPQKKIEKIQLLMEIGAKIPTNAIQTLCLYDVHISLIRFLIANGANRTTTELTNALYSLLLNFSLPPDRKLSIAKYLCDLDPRIVANGGIISKTMYNKARYDENTPLIMLLLGYFENPKMIVAKLLSSNSLSRSAYKALEDYDYKLHYLQHVRNVRSKSQKSMRSASRVMKQQSIMGQLSRMKPDLFQQLQSYIKRPSKRSRF